MRVLDAAQEAGFLLHRHTKNGLGMRTGCGVWIRHTSSSCTASGLNSDDINSCNQVHRHIPQLRSILRQTQTRFPYIAYTPWLTKPSAPHLDGDGFPRKFSFSHLRNNCGGNRIDQPINRPPPHACTSCGSVETMLNETSRAEHVKTGLVRVRE